MKRFARLLGATLGLAALALGVSVLPQKTVRANAATDVNVVNTPLPVTGSVRDADNPARIPFRGSFILNVNTGLTEFHNVAAVALPPKKGIVIEYVTGVCPIPAAAKVQVASLDFIYDETSPQHFVLDQIFPLPVTKSLTDGQGVVRFFASQLVRFYIETSGSATLGGWVRLTGPAPASGGIECQFFLTGYMVNLP
ncbi:MAG TPA: hypothetical protein VL099_12375 [Candidatus Binatia bacterium]|nr:hypothetical protein [Candidatus Binatia bacterium]